MSPNTTFPERRSGMVCGRLAAACVGFCALFSLEGARADQVIVRGVNYTDAKITQFNQGKLQLRTADDRNVSAWIDEIELLVVDRGGVFDDFNQAEQFLHKGEAQKAIARYERTLRLTQEFWADLIACRLLLAHDKAQQLDRAAIYFVRVANGEFAGPAAAARLYPKYFPEKRDGRVARALDTLKDEIRRVTDDPKTLTEILRYDILQRTDATAARPLDKSIIESVIPPAARTSEVYEVILRAMTEAARTMSAGDLLEAMDRAIEDCPDASLPGFLILKGNLLRKSAQSREDKIRAAWVFLRVPIHMPDHELAPQALLDAGVTVSEFDEKSGRALMQESYQHPKATPELRKQAEAPSP